MLGSARSCAPSGIKMPGAKNPILIAFWIHRLMFLTFQLSSVLFVDVRQQRRGNRGYVCDEQNNDKHT